MGMKQDISSRLVKNLSVMFFPSSAQLQAMQFFLCVTCLLSKELIPFINNERRKKKKKESKATCIHD